MIDQRKQILLAFFEFVHKQHRKEDLKLLIIPCEKSSTISFRLKCSSERFQIRFMETQDRQFKI